MQDRKLVVSMLPHMLREQVLSRDRVKEMQIANEDELMSLISKEDLMQLARKWRLQLSESEPAAFWAKYSSRGTLARILAFHVGEWHAIRQQWLRQRSIDIGPVGPRAKGGI